MARTKQETDELLLALMEWAEADPDAALIVATVNDGTHDLGSVITLGHAACTVVSALTAVAELLDVAEEQILGGTARCDAPQCLERIRTARIALGIGHAETVQ